MSSNSNRNAILLLIALVLPIVGYILYFMYRNSEKDKANEILACAIGGSILGIILLNL